MVDDVTKIITPSSVVAVGAARVIAATPALVMTYQAAVCGAIAPLAVIAVVLVCTGPSDAIEVNPVNVEVPVTVRFVPTLAAADMVTAPVRVEAADAVKAPVEVKVPAHVTLPVSVDAPVTAKVVSQVSAP